MSRAFDDWGRQRKVGVFAYLLAALSLLPAIGILFGAMSITWGLNTRKANGKRLAALAALGVFISIGASALLYRELGGFALMQRLQRLDTFDLMREGIAQSALDRLVPAIEYFKVERGRYPATLEELEESLPRDSGLIIIDPMTVKLGKTPTNFYYRVVDPDHYYLRSVGADGIPFTADDIVPDIVVAPGSKLGLLKKAPQQI